MQRDRPEDQVEEALAEPERTGDELEGRLGDLQEDIDEAKAQASTRREDAEPDLIAGDWEDESSGAHQGDDPSELDDPAAS